MRARQRGIPDQGIEDRTEPSRGEVRITDDLGRPRCPEHLGVRRLMVFGRTRPGDEHTRHADDRDFADEARARSTHDDVGSDECVGHALFISDEVVAKATRRERGHSTAKSIEVARADDVAHGQLASIAPGRDKLERDLVDVCRTERPSRHEDDRAIEREPE